MIEINKDLSGLIKRLIALRFSRKLSRLLPVMYTTTLGFVKNIRIYPVLLNGNPTLSRINIS